MGKNVKGRALNILVALFRRPRLLVGALLGLLLLIFLVSSNFSATIITPGGSIQIFGSERNRPQSLSHVLLKKIHDLVPGPYGVQKGSCKRIRYPEQPCLDTNCTGGMPRLATTRLKLLMDTRYHIPEDYRKILDAMVTERDRAEVHLITATSADHFREAEGVLADLRDKVILQLPSVRVFYYDLGLTDQQRELLKTHCKFCTLRRFPFSQLPPRFSLLRNYMWKPFLMAAHLPHSRFTVWMDASLRFQQKANLSLLFDSAASAGVLYSVDHHALPVHTAKETLAYFRIQPCWVSIYHEVQSGFLVWHNEPFIREIVMELWLSCTFSPDCLCPGQDCRRLWGCKWTKYREYSKCHRYDQTALALVLVSLVKEKVTAFHIPGGVIQFKRGDYNPFFPTTTTATTTTTTRRPTTSRASTHAAKGYNATSTSPTSQTAENVSSKPNKPAKS